MSIKEMRQRLVKMAERELRIFARRPVFLFCMIVAPIACIFFFTSLMGEGLPHKIPAGLVDEDRTNITRTVARILDAFEETDICRSYASFDEARRAVQRGDIYGFFFLPKGTTEEALASKQPRISFYTNDAYYVPANLLMKDMKTASELSGLALTRETLYAKGATEEQAMAIIRPIVVETHPLNNAVLDYSVYLSNMLVPGIMILLILLTTTYTIGLEWKKGSQRKWYAMAGRSPALALAGKLLPQTVVYCLLMVFMDVVFFRFLGYPCQCGIVAMMGLSVLTVLASQGFGIFLFGLMAGEMRLAMCICSLWGILSFSLAGFTYPVTAMATPYRVLAVWFPLRHYYLVYVNCALNGYPVGHVWPCIVALAAFCALPLLVLPRYRAAFLKFKYIQ